ncbi:potassium channel family protein [Acidobacteriota bacterium]
MIALLSMVLCVGYLLLTVCWSYQLYRNKEEKTLELKSRNRKCLHMYHYWIDDEFTFKWRFKKCKSHQHFFHRISTYKNTRKAFSDKGCLEFSTILALPNFLNIYVDKYISLTFINFCLDKGVHFKYNSFEILDTYFYNVSGLSEFIEENKKKFKFSNKTKFLPDNFYLILGEEATARYPIISRKIRDDMYLLSFKKKHPKMHFIWWLFADCGRSFFRWALWSLGFAIVFALIYYFSYTDYMLNFQTVYVSEAFPLFSFIYYSIVTFTTLGFGDIVPRTGWLQMWVMLEVILGYIMLGGLISILANKLARRS